MASIEDAAECGERADALVSGVLGRVMRQRRSIAAALDYVQHPEEAVALLPDLLRGRRGQEDRVGPRACRLWRIRSPRS